MFRAWGHVNSSSSGRDYATYHYAVQEAVDAARDGDVIKVAEVVRDLTRREGGRTPR